MIVKIVGTTGSYDPLTYGHLDIITRVSKMVERVVVIVAENTGKQCLFTLDERYEAVKQGVRDMANVKVDKWGGLTVEYCKKHKIQTLFRGIRTFSDFEYESSMSRLNRQIYPDLETIFVMANQRYIQINSNMVKEIARFGGDVSAWVPPHVVEQFQRKFKK